jgi:AcrR family transcriptional regulator
MSKGELTRRRILDVAMQVASRAGLDGLTIGSLSEALSLSKSGLFAHFGSKEALQVAVLEHTLARFVEHLAPRLRGVAMGVPMLRVYVAAWLDWIASPELPAGCPILGATFEIEAREGPPRDFVIQLHTNSRQRLAEIVQGAIDAGELVEKTDISQVIFELRGITLAFHQELHVLRNPAAREHANKAFSALLERYLRSEKSTAQGDGTRRKRRRDTT